MSIHTAMEKVRARLRRQTTDLGNVLSTRPLARWDGAIVIRTCKKVRTHSDR